MTATAISAPKALEPTPASLPIDEALSRLRREHPRLRALEAAQRLRISEAELVALEGNSRLRPDFGAILRALPALGEVMVLCRNHACVHERHGRYEKVSVNDGMGLVLGPDIDLRLFLNQWAYGFACRQQLPSGLRESLQFFDRHGAAVHKIYRLESTDTQAWERLVSTWIDPAPTTVRAETVATPKPPKADFEIDLPALRADWEKLRDTHDFYALLRGHQVQRPQAYRLVGAPLAYEVPRLAVADLLEDLATEGTPMMAFVGNRGAIQIHTGAINKVAWRGDWLNILDPRFNLHLDTRAITQAWIVRKPTVDGVVSSLELFDDAGELILQLFGARKPGQPELEDWRRLLGRLLADREHEVYP